MIKQWSIDCEEAVKHRESNCWPTKPLEGFLMRTRSQRQRRQQQGRQWQWRQRQSRQWQQRLEFLSHLPIEDHTEIPDKTHIIWVENELRHLRNALTGLKRITLEYLQISWVLWSIFCDHSRWGRSECLGRWSWPPRGTLFKDSWSDFGGKPSRRMLIQWWDGRRMYKCAN